MANTNNETKNETNDGLRISWFGMDGMFCLAYIVEAVLIGWSMIHDVDIVLGRLLPYSAMLVTAWVFLKYIFQVLSFSRGTRK